MAFFECTIGGASGDGVALIVDCDPSFAGSVITADNGEDSFSETCPTVAPYTVKFDGIPTGTFTISGVSGGVTIIKQYTVLDYNVDLHNIPNGATATPTDNIQIWLHCADIFDKNYSSISQVLADASTLQALIASNNAADYMARSTTWASAVCADANAMTYIGANDYCTNKLLANSVWLDAIVNSPYFENVLNVKIPTMTSNTAPSGEAFASSIYNNTYAAFKAFDGNNYSQWLPTSGATNNSIGYKFPSAIKGKLAFIMSSEVGASRTFEIVGTNGDVNHTLATVTISEVNRAYYVPLNNDDSYTHYFAFCSEVLAWSGGSHRVSTLQIYGRA